MLRKNALFTKLQAGQPVFGTWCVIPSAMVVDVIASAGLDFVVIDGEHGPIQYETAQTMVVACESRQVTPMMRVAAVSEPEIGRAFDLGAHGIHVPNIGTETDAKRVVEYSKYPPLGERGFSPFTRAGGYSLQNAQSLTRNANLNTLNVIHIEGPRAFEQLDGIGDLEGIDIIFIGLFDLSKAIGKPGEVEHPEVQAFLKRTVDHVSAKGKYVGTIATSPENAARFANMGVQYITYLVDCEVLRAAYQGLADTFRRTTNCTER